MRHDHGIDRACAGTGDRLDGQTLIFQEAVEDAPGKSAVAAAALKREVDGLGLHGALLLWHHVNGGCPG
ncbi:hypothetical protein [Hankyongella ginsenosidimutans]|uniref:hypothetical protein n=1 Tax=Hankyongella ginsenosidimutans TaxID=1763828 RepID=UPI001FEC9DF9|nr:hypothetical protein [Hankyongella ginsenosidimutans]